MLITRSAGACLLALLTSHLAAQEEDTPSDQMGSYAQVADASVELRCFPTENSPTFGDTMVDGAVVIVGESYGDFRQVVLPLGPVGYVHKKFATEPAGGMLMTAGNNVAFRYRPRSGEAPVELLPDQTELLVVGEDGDWWQVRFRAGQAWMPLAALRVFDEPNDTLVASYAELGKQQRKVVDDLELARVQAAAEAQYRADLQRRLDTICCGTRWRRSSSASATSSTPCSSPWPRAAMRCWWGSPAWPRRCSCPRWPERCR